MQYTPGDKPAGHQAIHAKSKRETMTSAREDWQYTGEYDAGDRSCGELILELRQYFDPLKAGSLVCVITRDSGAPVDLTAWCRSTGHRMIDMDPPYYLIQRRS